MGVTTRKLRLRVSGNTPKPFSIGNKNWKGHIAHPIPIDRRYLQTTFAGQWILPNPLTYMNNEWR